MPPAPARGPSWETAVGALAARPGGAPHWVDQLDRFRRRVAADEPPEDDRWYPDTEIVVPRFLMRGRAPAG
jgi:hypothetical protein